MTLSGENIVSPHQYFLDLHVFLFIVVKNWMDLSLFFFFSPYAQIRSTQGPHRSCSRAFKYSFYQ